MDRRAGIIAGAACALVGVVILLVVITTGTASVREHIAEEYQRVDDPDPAFEGALVYTSPRPAAAVAGSIAGAFKPAERHNEPSAYFLRYRNDFVVVTPAQAGTGSRIYVDSEGRGYQRWYPYVGGYWGTYSGPGDVFRGGGPGAGK